MKQFPRFAVVGTLGFVTAVVALWLAVSVLGVRPLAGRLLSFLVAATVTWIANRRYTFAQTGEGSAGE